MFPASWLRANLYRVVVAVAAVLLVGLVFGVESMTASQFSEPADGDAEFQCPAYAPLEPVKGGRSHAVANQVELAAALKDARPGDTINLGSQIYDKINFRAAYGHQSGNSSAPIVIQAAAGSTPIIDPGSGSVSDRYAVTVFDLDHVLVRGLEIRHGVNGAVISGASSVTFEHNNIHDVAMAGLVVNSSADQDGLRPSRDITVRCNGIHRTGLTHPEYGEGIYLGSGSTGVVDATKAVTIEGNEIFLTSNEAIDVKRHVTNVTIRHNRIHDITPYYGGAISLGLNKNSWGPANYLVEYNRIWSIRSGLYYAQAIAVAHGPTTIRHNVIWDVETSASDTWPWTSPIQVHGDDTEADWAYGFGNPSATNVTITGNTVVGCTAACISSHTEAGQIQPEISVSDNIVDQASSGDAANSSDTVISVADLVGPVSGSADRGAGPGSGLELLPRTDRNATTTTPPSSTVTTMPSSTPTTSPSTSSPTSAPSTTTVSPTSDSPVTSTTSMPEDTTTSTSPPTSPTTQAPTTQAPTTQAVTAVPTTQPEDDGSRVRPGSQRPNDAESGTSTPVTSSSKTAIFDSDDGEADRAEASGPIIRSSARSWSKWPPDAGRDTVGYGANPVEQMIMIGSWYR